MTTSLERRDDHRGTRREHDDDRLIDWSRLVAWLRSERVRPFRLPFLVVAVGLLVQVTVLVRLASRLWFVGDDWDFLLTRGTVPGESVGWWVPHNEHWSTVHVLVFRVIFAYDGMHHYLSYAGVQIAMHAGIAVMMFVLLARLGTRPWPTALGTLFVVFLGAGNDTLLSTTSLNHTGSVFMGVVAATLYERRGSSGRSLLWLWALLLVAVMWSASGIPVVCFVAAWVAFDRELRYGVVAASVPAAAHVTWFALAGRKGESHLPTQGWDFTKAPEYFWTGYTQAFENTAGIPGSGAILLLGLLAVTLTATDVPHRRQAIALAGWAGATLYFVMVGVFRITWGLESTESGRYVYASMVFLTPAIVIALERAYRALRSPRWFNLGLLALAVALYVVHGVNAEYRYYQDLREVSKSWPDRVQGVLDAVDDGQRPLTDRSGEYWGPTMTAELLASPEIRAALPVRESTTWGRAEAENMFFTAVSDVPLGLPEPEETTTFFGFSGGIDDEDACSTVEATSGATLVLEIGAGGSGITVEGPSGEDPIDVVTSVVRDEESSDERTWSVEADVLHIGSTAAGAELAVSFERSGEYSVCLGDPEP